MMTLSLIGLGNLDPLSDSNFLKRLFTLVKLFQELFEYAANNNLFKFFLLLSQL